MTIQTWWADLPTEQLMESSWERQMNLAGIDEFERRRYKENGDVQEASKTISGQKMIRKMLDAAEKGITEMQDELLNTTRVSRNLRGTVLMVPAETVALLTVKIILDRAYGTSDSEIGVNFQAVCVEVSKAIELELNFRNWVSKSRADAKAFAAAQGLTKAPKSRAERLMEEGKMDRVKLWHWKKTFAELQEYRWDTLESHYCGEAVVRAVVGALPDRFEIVRVEHGHKSENRLKMTPEFRSSFDASEARLVKMQVVKKPMLSKPRPWKKDQ
jgi:hypothetical protein